MEWVLELWAAPAALGFAMLFNVPPRSLFFCGVLAIAGHALRKLVLFGGGDPVLGTLIAALIIGIAAELWAQRRNEPGAIYAISAAIPMIPGTYLYKAMQSLLGIAMLPAQAQHGGQELLMSAGLSGIRAVMIILALAFGIAAPQLLWRRG